MALTQENLAFDRTRMLTSMSGAVVKFASTPSLFLVFESWLGIASLIETLLGISFSRPQACEEKLLFLCNSGARQPWPWSSRSISTAAMY